MLIVTVPIKAPGAGGGGPFCFTHVSALNKFPPLQVQPNSIWQVDEHPSPLAVLPSSQGKLNFFPSPQI